MHRLPAIGAVFLAMAALAAPAAAATTRPNILLIMTDDQRADGTLEVMPATRRLIGAHGVKFLEAHATTPKCCPSRSSFFTGRYAHNHGVVNNSVPARLDQSKTVQRHLQDRGYRTGIFGKFLNAWPAQVDPPYFDEWAITEGGYGQAAWNLDGRVRRVRHYTTDLISDRTARFLRTTERIDDQPWLAWVTPYAPHAPSTPARRHRDAPLPSFPLTPAMTESDYSDKPAFLDRARGEPELLARVRDDGRRSLMAVDEMVDRFGRLLRRLGELRDTLVVFTSDNGIMLGEHGGVVGKDLPYPASTRIPLLVRWPGRATAGRTRTDFVTNVDVAATFLDAAGVHRQTDGWPLFSGHRRRTLFGEAFGARNRRGAQVLPPWRSLTTRSYRYAEYTDQGHHLIAREYYDHRTDPWELENRAATLAQSRVDRLSGLLRELGRCRGASCP